MFRKVIVFIVLASLLVEGFLFPYPVYAQLFVEQLPSAGALVAVSPSYKPLMIKGLKTDPEHPLRFDFLISSGDSGLKEDQVLLREQSQRLIKYFLACLTIPEDDLWVNLSPYEKDRMVPDNLGRTELGRDMLAQDYILKQLTASLIDPNKQLGQAFWDRIYKKARELYGATEVPLNTFNKVWILADTAKIFQKGNTAYLVSSHLNVMLDEDYDALRKNSQENKSSKGMTKEKPTHTLGSQIIREIILPEIEREVNEGKNFQTIRQIFNSFILAGWYKKNLKETLLNKVYADKSKIQGIDLSDPNVKEEIYQRYLEAYKKGVFNFIKEDVDATTKETIARKYFSGGTQLKDNALIVTQASELKPQELSSIAEADLVVTADIKDTAMTATKRDYSPHERSKRVLKYFLNDKWIEGVLKDRHVEFPDQGRDLKIVLIGPGQDAGDLDDLVDRYPLAKQIDVVDFMDISGYIEEFKRARAGMPLPDIRFHHKSILDMAGEIKDADMVLGFFVFDEAFFENDSLNKVGTIVKDMLKPNGIYAEQHVELLNMYEGRWLDKKAFQVYRFKKDTRDSTSTTVAVKLPQEQSQPTSIQIFSADSAMIVAEGEGVEFASVDHPQTWQEAKRALAPRIEHFKFLGEHSASGIALFLKEGGIVWNWHEQAKPHIVMAIQAGLMEPDDKRYLGTRVYVVDKEVELTIPALDNMEIFINAAELLGLDKQQVPQIKAEIKKNRYFMDFLKKQIYLTAKLLVDTAPAFAKYKLSLGSESMFNSYQGNLEDFLKKYQDLDQAMSASIELTDEQRKDLEPVIRKIFIEGDDTPGFYDGFDIDHPGNYVHVVRLHKYPHLVFKFFKERVTNWILNPFKLQFDAMTRIVEAKNKEGYVHQKKVDGFELVFISPDNVPAVAPFGYFKIDKIGGIVEELGDTEAVQDKDLEKVRKRINQMGLEWHDASYSNIARFDGDPAIIDKGLLWLADDSLLPEDDAMTVSVADELRTYLNSSPFVSRIKLSNPYTDEELRIAEPFEPRMIARAMFDLIENALDEQPEGQISLEIRKADGRIYFSVSNQGSIDWDTLRARALSKADKIRSDRQTGGLYVDDRMVSFDSFDPLVGEAHLRTMPKEELLWIRSLNTDVKSGKLGHNGIALAGMYLLFKEKGAGLSVTSQNGQVTFTMEFNANDRLKQKLLVKEAPSMESLGIVYADRQHPHSLEKARGHLSERLKRLKDDLGKHKFSGVMAFVPDQRVIWLVDDFAIDHRSNARLLELWEPQLSDFPGLRVQAYNGRLELIPSGLKNMAAYIKNSGLFGLNPFDVPLHKSKINESAKFRDLLRRQVYEAARLFLAADPQLASHELVTDNVVLFEGFSGNVSDFIKTYAELNRSDEAMTVKGGIDLKASDLKMDIDRQSGPEVLDKGAQHADLLRFEASKGFIPVIIRITPLQGAWEILGLEAV